MIKYDEFINEMAKVHDMRVGNYVLFNSNIKNSDTPTKGKYAKITKAGWGKTARVYTLEFETPIIIKRVDGEGNIVKEETRTIDISSHQIKTLRSIPAEHIEAFKSGYNMIYTSSGAFNTVLQDISFYIRNRDYLDCSYFDVDAEKDDMISFLPAGKSKTSIELKEDPYRSKFRQSTKIGRILKKLNTTLTDAQVENFVHEYRAIWKMIYGDIGDRLKIVSGDLIPYWYNVNRYAQGGGTLNSSCMRYENVQNRIKFYAKYPDKISMAILLDDKDKLLARALIWKLDEPANTVFMDRIYYVKSCHSKILENYAHKNDMKLKIDNWNLKNRMVVRLPYKLGQDLPFLDSFRWDDGSKQFINR